MIYLLATAKCDGPILDRVCRDLARIHIELLSHPSDKIGMLEITEEFPTFSVQHSDHVL
jgi:hypothetical protein